MYRTCMSIGIGSHLTQRQTSTYYTDRSVCSMHFYILHTAQTARYVT